MESERSAGPSIREGLGIGRKQRTAAGLLAILGGVGVASDRPVLQYAGIAALTLTVILLVVVVAMRLRYVRADGVPSNSGSVRSGLRGSTCVVIGALIVVLGSRSDTYAVASLIGGFCFIAVGLYIFFRPGSSSGEGRA